MKKLLKYLFLFFPVILNSQEAVFQYQLGYGSFQLKDVKAMFDRVGLTFAKTTEYFPSNYLYSPSLGIISGQHYCGLKVTLFSTGARSHIADYSGESKADMIVNGNRLGFFYRYNIPHESKWNMYLQFEPGFVFSKLKIYEELVIGRRKIIDEILHFKSKGMYFEPSMGFRYKPLNWLHLALGCGYEIDAFGKMNLSYASNSNIKYNGNDKIKWNGIRLYAGLILVIPNDNQNSM